MALGIDDISFECFLNSLPWHELMWHAKSYFSVDKTRQILMEQEWDYGDFLLNLMGIDFEDSPLKLHEQLISTLNETDEKNLIGLFVNLTPKEIIIKHLLDSTDEEAREEILFNNQAK